MPRCSNRTRDEYVRWIFDVAGAVAREFRTRDGRIFIYGHSQGGQFGLLSALQRPNRVASLLVQAGSGASATLATDERLATLTQHGVRVWIVHGREDPTVPVATSTALAARLKTAGVATTLHIVAGGHSVNDEMRAIGRRWLDEVARGGK
jgi:phospholipase/carboxylesterase